MHKKCLGFLLLLVILMEPTVIITEKSKIKLSTNITNAQFGNNGSSSSTSLGSSAGEYGKCIAMKGLVDKAKDAAINYLNNQADQGGGFGGALSSLGFGGSGGGLGGGGGDAVPIKNDTLESKAKETQKNTKGTETKAEEQVRLERKKECFKEVAKTVLTKMTQKTIDWALTGFEGEPFYVKDQGSFIKSIEDEVTIKKIEDLKNCVGTTCPFGRELAKSIITVEKNNALSDTEKFTLNKGNPNWKDFVKGNFSKGGGWNTFLSYTQNPKNNPFGDFLSTSFEINNKKTEEVTKTQTELAQNQGFLSLKKCVETAGKNNTPTSVGGVGTAIGAAGQGALDCLRYEVTTPGGLIREQLTKALNLSTEQKQAEANQGTENIEQLANLAVDLIGKGLNQLGQSKSGGPSGSGGQGSNTSYLNTLSNAGSWSNTPPAFEFELENTTTPGTPGKDLKDAITRITKEIGIIEQQLVILNTFPQKTKTLDECLPGPDLNWKNQFTAEYTSETSAVRAVAEQNANYWNVQNKVDAMAGIATLDGLYNADLQNIKTNIENSIPSFTTIQSQINKIVEYNNRKNETKSRLQQRKDVLTKLNLIKNKIAANPSQLVNGTLINNPSQKIETLRISFKSVLEFIIDDNGVNSAQNDLFNLENENELAFDQSNGVSTMSLCVSERHSLSNTLIGKDQGQTLYCNWQTPLVSGNTTNIFGDPIVSRLIGGQYSQNFDPYRTNSSYGSGTSTSSSIPVKIECSSFYRAPLDYYENLF